MVETSAKWKASFNEYMMGENFVEVSIDKSVRAFLSNATVSTTSDILPQTDLQSVISAGARTRSGTIETNIWVMDNTTAWLSNNSVVGFVSNELSGENKMFVSEPEITITLPTAKDIPGFTVTWCDTFREWAEDFDIAFFDSNNDLIEKKQVTGNGNIKYCVIDTIDSCKKIVITVKKWCLSGRRARIEDAVAGILLTFTKHELMHFSSEQTQSPINAELPAYRLDFTIDNYDGKYNTGGEFDINEFLEPHIAVYVKYGMTLSDNTIEYINGGRFILDTWSFDNSGYSFSVIARDPFYFMTNKFFKGTYSTNGYSLYELALSVLQDASHQYNFILGWNLDSALSSIHTKAYLPEMTHAELLQMIAQSAGMVLSYARNGVIKIEPVAMESQDSQGNIGRINFYEYPVYDLIAYPDKINCKVYDYSTDKVEITSAHFPNVNGCVQSPPITYITMQDYVAICTAATKIGTGESTGLTPEQETRADVDMDGTITAKDASVIPYFIASCGNGKYTNDLSGWEEYYNETIGSKKIIAQSQVTLDPNEGITISINHSASYDVSVRADNSSVTIQSMTSYVCLTTVTIAAGTGTHTITLYGYPIDKSSVDYETPITSDEMNIEVIDNPFTASTSSADNSNDVVKEWLSNDSSVRISKFRADPAFDVGAVHIENQLAYITEYKIAFTGMFKGSLSGRLIKEVAP